MVFSALVGGNHTAFYRQWAAAGLKGSIPISSTTFGLVNELAALEPAESNGIVSGYGYYEELKTDASVKFVSALKEKFPGIPYISELAAGTYEGFHLWVKAAQQAKSIDRMKVIEALETGLSFDGPTGKVTLDKATHHSVRNAFLAEAKDKLWDVVASYPDQKPSDTAAVCDLVKNPNDNKQYVISL